MQNFLSKLFGPSWRSSTSGVITVVAVTTALVINGDHTLVAFLPDKLEEYIVGISKIVAIVSGVIFALSVKDNRVTGGSIPQTVEAEHRAEKIERNLVNKNRKNI
jgi:hypothetical protein